ncbi:arginine-hydroxylase NDUFAF5, mitochondrial-like isoform X2 [Actinia tenebrosa]|uniref:Arginine-hydroxylase NDUFAF5, mitochondrial-like isoform X2 n=1 Tax=Actinia tenebrosa TaxID=6105 RepID=A0A6P8IBL3_ACTTE|nr:arginine-hydroxylase NDUFAF5, mitochondrial-like isoform X2 [Actinia tenebrosa]
MVLKNITSRFSWLYLRRLYSSMREQDNIMDVFDRKVKRIQRNRAAMREDVALYDYVKDEIGSRVADRINDISRNFPMVLDLGCGRGHIGKHLSKEQVGNLVLYDSAEKLLEQCEIKDIPTVKINGDEEFLSFKESTFDLIVSSLSLHWVNNLPGTFQQVLYSLKPDGAFIGAIFAGDTLYQLRSALQVAEMERDGGFAAHISPFTQMRDIGNLLTRAGFNLTTVDADEITVGYPSMFDLLNDLKGMGENNASRKRKNILNRDTLQAAAAIYKGWKPDKTQQQPAKRGSAAVSLKDLSSLDSLDDKPDKVKN